MRGNASIPGSSNKRFPTFHWNMLSGLDILISLSQAKVNHKNSLAFFFFTDHEIIGLDIAMNKSLPVDALDSSNYLNRDINGGGYSEFFVAKLLGEYHIWKRS